MQLPKPYPFILKQNLYVSFHLTPQCNSKGEEWKNLLSHMNTKVKFNKNNQLFLLFLTGCQKTHPISAETLACILYKIIVFNFQCLTQKSISLCCIIQQVIDLSLFTFFCFGVQLVQSQCQCSQLKTKDKSSSIS